VVVRTERGQKDLEGEGWRISNADVHKRGAGQCSTPVSM
jgi:hypothetical protein